MTKDATAAIPRFYRVAKEDNVAVALAPLERGEVVEIDGHSIVLRSAIPGGHKFALHAIAETDQVIRYRAPIGLATQFINAGDHVHTHNLRTGLSGEVEYSFSDGAVAAENLTPDGSRSFQGYVRDDGLVGTRNEIWILPTVGCVGRLGERLAMAGLARFGDHVDAISAFNHPFGCSQLGADLAGTASILASLAQNPNAGGVLLLGLGCESNQLDDLLARIPLPRRARLRVLRAQSEADEFAAGLEAIAELAELMVKDKRETVPFSALRLGVKCGGSDAMSGLTANPLIGRMSDLVTVAGGTAILTEIPEIFGAEHLLMARAENESVFKRLAEVTNRFKRYFLDNGEPVSENPSPGNIAGGITTLEEKSLGAVQKGGLATVVDVIDYGDRAKLPGLTIVEAPGNDAVSTTALAAAGATITLFSTGRGTPLGSPVPTLKIASNSALASSKRGWIDFDGGQVFVDGMDLCAESLLDLILKTASGKQARNEINEERAIGIWKRGVTL